MAELNAASPLPTARFLRACRGLPVDRTPIWLMRQAGRYMSEYRALRAQHSMLELIATPELAARVTLQPLEAFDLDAGIIFADILPPLMGMGLELRFVEGRGPVIDNPVRKTADVDRLETPPAAEAMPGTLAAIRIVSGELEHRDVPLIGFAGAPFTLASYAIEGEGSKVYAHVKSFMYTETAAWDRLMEKLVAVQADYLIAQVAAGAQALQVFDSWAGLALGRSDYRRYVQRHHRDLFDRLAATGVPVIHFSTGTAAYIEDVVAAGGDVAGVDFRMPIDWYSSRIGKGMPVQGNLDPIALLAPWSELRSKADEVLDAAAGFADSAGHIFNLGHGILPQTPVESVARLVDHVHARSTRDAASALAREGRKDSSARTRSPGRRLPGGGRRRDPQEDQTE